MRKIFEYFERNPELRVLFVFNNPFLKDELDGTEWPAGYRYVPFQGDWFTVKCLIDTEWAEERVVMYFDQKSPLENRDLRNDFPLLDVLAANMEYQQQDYAAFMQQFRIPEALTNFVQRNIVQLQSGAMIRLLQPYYNDGSITTDVGTRALLSSFLKEKQVLSWADIIIKIILSGNENNRVKQKDFYPKLSKCPSTKEALDNKLQGIFGAGIDYNSVEKVERIVKAMKYNAITQRLTPVQADTYQTLRINDPVALQEMNSIMEQAASKRTTAENFAGTINQLGKEIREEKIIEWYGADADYCYMTYELCIPILRTLMEQTIGESPKRVTERVEVLMQTQGNNQNLRPALDFVQCVARYYSHVREMGSFTLNSTDEYVSKYQTTYYAVDQNYRLVVEAYYKIDPSAALFDTIQQTKVRLDADYAKTANRLNIEWTRCLTDKGGFGSVNLLRQQDFYETKIKPMQKKVVVIVSDALRYELAQELLGLVTKSKHTARLETALAMLPTETKYCKPSLLPHKELELYGVEGELNMSVDKKELKNTEERSAHIGGYHEGAVCVTYEKVAQYDRNENREIFKHPLVYIFHGDIDDTGHDAPAKQVVNMCRQAVNDLATLIKKIHDDYNVTEVYVTSDHGFLFNDVKFEERDRLPVNEETIERKSRYYITTSSAPKQDMVKYPFQAVSTLKNVEELFVAVPMGTNRLKASGGGYMFAHGGASMQEVLIPVLISHYERRNTKAPVGVTLLDNRKLSVQSSRLRFKLLQTDAVDLETQERVVKVALYAGHHEVTSPMTIRLDKTAASLDDRVFLVDLTLYRNVDSRVLQLRVYDVNDTMNPLIQENVINSTLIENDFD